MSSFYSDTGSDLKEQIHRLASFNRHVAHDLRGPLGSVASAAQLAQQALARGDDRSADRLLQLVAASAEDLAQLLADLLSLAQAHDAPLTQASVDLTELARCAMDQVRLASDGMSHTFNLQDLPTVTGASGLLRQVFVNLLGNAVKFSRYVDAPTIDVGSAVVSGERVIYVRDNGVGFDGARAPDLFQPFSRLHGGEYPGHGIGLSLVRRIVERHGGRIWAVCPARGAMFQFTLAGMA